MEMMKTSKVMMKAAVETELAKRKTRLNDAGVNCHVEMTLCHPGYF
jgi:hypothetical protein